MLTTSMLGQKLVNRPFTASKACPRPMVLTRVAKPPMQLTSSSRSSTTAAEIHKFPAENSAGLAVLATFALQMLITESASAVTPTEENPFAGVQANSLYVTLLLFLMCVPGIWSQVKRAPQANKKRKVFEVDGPGKEGGISLDARARAIFQYFKKYNYEVKEMGEVITFVGLYAADKGQAAAVTFYTFVGMACIALVLSTVYPWGGNWWYSLTLLSPAAWFYYFKKGTRPEEFKVKMVTSDNDMTTDIIVEGDVEEITRLSKELDLVEKGMVRVKGIFETA